MTEKDNKRFMALLLPLSAIYGQEMPEDQIFGYWLALKPHLTIEEFERAVGIAAASHKWLPKPSELIEIIKPSKALAAWDVFRKVARGHIRNSIDFEDKTINAVVRSLGGLSDASKVPSEKFNSFYRKDFLEAYGAFERQGLDSVDSGPLMVRGYHEGAGYLPGRGIACGYVSDGCINPKRISENRNEK
jgi:hypothetical protein